MNEVIKLDFFVLTPVVVVLGDLGVTCSPRDPRFAGSNPTEVDEFFRTKNS